MKLFKLFVAIAILSSCSIAQEYYFNNDFSGNYKMVFDMTDLMSLAGEEDEKEDLLDQETKDSIITANNEIDGISNTQVTSEGYLMILSYDFANLDALNSALAKSSMGDEMGDDPTASMLNNSGIEFKGKGKKLTYTIPEFSTYDIEDSTLMYMDMIDLKATFTFERDVKSVENTSALIQENGKSVVIEGNFKEFAEGQKTLSTEFKLK